MVRMAEWLGGGGEEWEEECMAKSLSARDICKASRKKKKFKAQKKKNPKKKQKS